MPLLRGAALEALLACPVCRAPLSSREGRLFCGRPGCRYAAVPFVQAGGLPVLVDFERSILREAEVVRDDAASVVPRSRPRLVRLGRRVLMPNPVARCNARRLRRLLSPATPSPVVLIIGGGVVGNGLDELYSDPSLNLIGLDLYASPLVQVVADGHQIPLADQSVDAVVIQAVLQSTLEPRVVVDEIHRVLRPDGLVYAETGFLQQVCEGPYDFYRFTERGHRYLFRRFEEVDSGVVAGPGTQVVWTLDYLARGLLRSRGSGRVVRALASWLRHLDRFIPYPYRIDDASCVYFLGRKQLHEVAVEDVVKGYRGAQRPSVEGT